MIIDWYRDLQLRVSRLQSLLLHGSLSSACAISGGGSTPAFPPRKRILPANATNRAPTSEAQAAAAAHLHTSLGLSLSLTHHTPNHNTTLPHTSRTKAAAAQRSDLYKPAMEVPGGFEQPSPFEPSPFSTFSAAPIPPADPPTPPPEADCHTCRICLEQVPPPYAPDPELGRLISPCTCKGSSRFVHQGCLQQWRLSSANQANFYQCPTCHYQYRFRRLKLAAVVGSSGVRLGITSGIMVLAVYLLGFVAEPIINTYLDPPALFLGRSAPQPPISLTGWRTGALALWGEHMLKGFASLGLLGFLKVMYLLGPNSVWNLRSGLGSGIGRSGRDRAAQISWLVVVIGVINFFVFTWGQVGGLVRKWMEKAADEILEVSHEDEGIKEE